MKKWKKLIMSVLTAGLLVSLMAGTVLAAEDSYTYTLRFSTGVQGSFTNLSGLSVSNSDADISRDGDLITVSNLLAGDVVSFNAQSSVSLAADSKYYVQGVRLSGRDNSTRAAATFTVEKDADYVVAYGVKGESVSYVVNYMHADGRTLAESSIFYGNAGEKPVVAYQYIEGYVPQVYGYTKTLSANSAENVFSFVYEDAPTGTVIETPGTTGTGTATGGTTSGTAAGQDQTTEAPGNAGDAQPGTDVNTPDDETPDDGNVEEGDRVVDLDEEVPLADQDTSASAQAAPIVLGIVIAGVAIVALILIILFVKNNFASRV